MATTYKVRIWAIETYKGTRGNTYKVVWLVAGERHKETYKTVALAESFRSQLLSAARKGEAFDVDSGLPVSMARTANDMSWYDFACKFVDLKWPRVAATTRRTHAEAMTALMPRMLASKLVCHAAQPQRHPDSYGEDRWNHHGRGERHNRSEFQGLSPSAPRPRRTP